MALRYSYDKGQGGWVIDNKGSFQTPFRIGQYYGQDVHGSRMYDEVLNDDLPGNTDALVLGYARDDKNQCYIDSSAPRNPYESSGCPGKKHIPQKSTTLAKRAPAPPPPSFGTHVWRDLVALLAVFLLTVIAVFVFQAIFEK